MERKEGYYHITHDGEDFIAKYEECRHGEFKGMFMFHYTYGSEIIITDVVDYVDEYRILKQDEATDEIIVAELYESANKCIGADGAVVEIWFRNALKDYQIVRK